MFHSVGMLFNCAPFEDWKVNEKRECVLVIIGKHLEYNWLKQVFHKAAIVPPVEVKEIKRKSHEHHEGHDHNDSHDSHDSHDHHDSHEHHESLEQHETNENHQNRSNTETH